MVDMNRSLELLSKVLHSIVELIQLLDQKYSGWRWLHVLMGILFGITIAWMLGTRVVSRSMFRSALSRVGWQYHSMYISPFSFAVIITDVFACAYSCPILRNILLSVLPSINVKAASSSTLKVRQIIFRPSIVFVWRRVPWITGKGEDMRTETSTSASIATPPVEAPSQGRTFPIPAPQFIIELRDVCIEMEKLYVAPLFDFDNAATPAQRLPSALLATQTVVEEHRKQQPPTYFEENIAMLESNRADSVTYVLEQWIQQQSTKNDAKSSTVQRLVQRILHLIISSFSLKVHKFSCRVYGPDVEIIRSVRKKEKNPSDALIALAAVTKNLCATTEFGFHGMEFSFHGCNYELLITINQFYIQVGIPKSRPDQKVPRMSWARKRKDSSTNASSSKYNDGRTWSYVTSPNDGLVNISGVLDWLIGDTWDTKLLAVTCSFLESCLNLDPERVHTLFLHLDDHLDASSPFNEWRQWYSQNIKIKPSSLDQLLQDYRNCYLEQWVLQHKNVSNTEKNTTLPQPKCDSGDGGISMQKNRSMLKTLERQMTFEQIMDQRRQVMGASWDVPRNNNELKEYVTLNRRNHSLPISHDNSKNKSKSDSQVQKYWFDVLIHFVEQKTSFAAVLFTISIVLPSFKVVLVKIDDVTHNQKEVCTHGIVLIDLYSKLQWRNPALSYKPRSNFLVGQKPKCFMKLDGSIQQVLCIAEDEDTFSSLPHGVDPYAAKLPLGLSFKHPAADPFKESFNWSVFLTSKLEATQPHLNATLDLSDVLFTYIPQLTEDSLNTFIAASDLPYWVGCVENMDDVSTATEESLESHSDNPQRENQIEEIIESFEAIPAFDDLEQSYLLMGGTHMNVSFNLRNVSFVVFMDGSSLNGNALDLNIQHAELTLLSCPDSEDISFTADRISATACRLVPSRTFKCGVQIGRMPIKEALLIEQLLLQYNGMTTSNEKHIENSIRATKKVQFVQVENLSKSSQARTDTVKMRINITLRKILVNTSPTVMLVLSGFNKSLPKRATHAEADVDNAAMNSPTAEAENEDAKYDLDRLRVKYPLIFEKTQMSREDLKHVLSEMLVKSRSDVPDSKKTNSLTKKEFQRELDTLFKSIDDNFQDDAVDVVALMSFIQQLQWNGGLKFDEPIHKNAFSFKHLLGIIHFDDFREYTSTVEVYWITGCKEKQNYPPVINWRQGKGIERFWHLYCSETGCSRTSLNGQDVMQVQIKLVRALCNYEFAKYCWKVLVRPNLQEMSLHSGSSHHSRRKQLNFKVPVTDWLLDRKTSYAARNHSFQEKMQRWMVIPTNSTKKTSTFLMIPYDVGLLIEVQEIVCTFGNGTTGSTPLLNFRISNCNFSALLFLFRSSLTGFSCDFDTETAESQQYIALVRKDDSHAKSKPFNPQEGAQAQVHCEITLEASYLNAKHNIMDILMEPFFCFAHGSYQTNKASFNSILRLLTSTSGKPSRDFKQKEVNERTSSSLRISCPQFLGLNTSPALLETFSFVKVLIFGCVPESYEQINEKRLEENLKNMWKSFSGDVASELDNVSLKEMISKHFKSMSWKRLDEEIDDLASELSRCDVDRNGFVSLEEAKLSLSKSRRASLFALPGEARLKNKTGVALSFCSTAAYKKLGDAALETLEAGELKIMNLSSDFSFPSTVQKSQMSHFSLLIPKFNFIHNIPVANFQVFMVPLIPSVSNTTFAANERKSRRDAGSVSGFASLLTFRAVSDILDTVTVQVRPCVTVEALTPIDFRIVRVSANVAFNQLDLTSMKRLVNYLEVLGDGGIIVHETLRVPKKKQLPIPLYVLTSPYLHMLYFRDIDDVQRQWRAGILLNYDFLSNSRNRAEISRYHARAGISVQFDRLTCLQNPSLEEKEAATTKYTALDTVIRVFPKFVVRNALPFGLVFKCWQSAVEVGKPRLGKSVKWFPEESSVDGSLVSDENGLLPEKNTTVRRHSLADTSVLDFYDFGYIEEGSSVNLNGVDIGKKLFLQITQALNVHRSKMSVTRHRFPLKAKPELYWTAPIQLDLDLLQAGGNISGRLSLPEIITPLGDEVDVSLKIEVEPSGSTCLTLFSPYWIINKSLMKMEYKFSGNEAIILDSGVGGLPILVSCKEKESSLDTLLAKKREISVRPVERPTEGTKSVWWDNANGDLTFMDPLLRKGTTAQVHWCEPMVLDKTGTRNEINCGGVLIGSSISTMTGIFHRSNLISFQPRFIVQNHLRYPILIASLEGPQNQIEDLLKDIHGHTVKNSSWDLFTLGPGQSTIVYRFAEVAMFSQISRSRYICFHSHGLKRKHRWHLIVVDSGEPQFFVERSQHTAAVIDIIRVEPHEIDACSVIKLVHCEIPPFRLENRSNEHIIRFSQDGEDTIQELAPMTWCGYYWDNPVGILKLRVAAASPNENGEHFITATPNEPNRRFQFRYYQFKNVGKMKDLPCSDQSDVFLSVSLRMIGGSRVLSFSDSSWHCDQNEFGCLRRGGNWKNVQIEISLAGFVLSLSDYYPREVLSMTVKSLFVTKHTGEVDTNLRICLVQIDAMQGSARYPIMLAPAKNVDFMIRPSLQQGADHKKHEIGETFNDANLSPPLRTYWDDQNEQHIPIFEANISYLPQPSVLWIPEIAISFCPIKIQVDIKYVLRIVNLLYSNLFLNFYPEFDDEHHLKDVSDLLEHLNSHLRIPQLPIEYLSKSYFEKVRVNETYVDIDLDLKSDDSVFDANYDEQDSTISLTSLGRVTKSAISASLLSWVNIASTAFSMISPKFKFSGFVRDDCYSSVIELFRSIINFYTESLVKQSYKVLFTAHRLGDPTQLYEDIRTGCYELFVISRESGIGMGTESFIRNAIGGFFDFLGRLSGSTAELLEELVLCDALTNKKALFSTRPPEHFAEGFMQGSLFFTLSLTQGIIVLVKDPYKGIKARSPRKATVGLFRGASGLVASPLIGALGFFSKSFDGVKATTHLLEKKVVESRCRPKRVSSWGGSLGSIGIDYLKAIGIRIHVVRFQQKSKDFYSAAAASGTISHSSNKSTDSKSKKSETVGTTNENEVTVARNPRRLILLRQSKGKFCLPSRSATPITVKQSSKGSTLMTKYDVLFEETLVLRLQDMQFSDHISLELWKSNTYYSHTRKKKPIAACSFSVQEAFLSLLLLRQSLLDQVLLQSTHLSNLRPDVVTAKDILVPPLISHEEKGRRTPEVKPMTDIYSTGYCKGIFNQDSLTHVVMPPIQEYSLKKVRSGRRNHTSDSTNIVKDIENELDYVEGQYASIIQSLDEGSFSDSTTTSNSSDFFGENSEIEPTKQPTTAERYRNEREEVYGQVYVSFIPISW